ncbi:UNC5C-like protein isoform X2 [Dendronephthya gigantea]|nr:UNC5C-like protein isoform X2 [Dendronephthya gigantea]
MNRSAESVINNVTYQQKGRSLVISRTDVDGSGMYQSLARNTAGVEWGRIYKVEFYEAKVFSMTMNESKDHFTVNHDKETTKMTKYPNIVITSQSTPIVPEFIRNGNGSAGTYNDKEEADDKRTIKENNINTTKIVFIAIAIVCLIIIIGLVNIKCILHRNTRASMDMDPQQSRLDFLVCCKVNKKSSWASVNSIASDIHDVPNDRDSINHKLGALHDVFEEPIAFLAGSFNIYHSKTEDASTSYDPEITRIFSTPHIGIFSSQCMDRTSSKQRDMLESTGSSALSQSSRNQFTFTPIFDPFCCSELSFDATIDERFPHASTTIYGQSKELHTPNLSTSSHTSSLLNRLITIPPNTDQRYIANALIDHTGGEVVLPRTGIRLVIPEGALDFGRTEVIKIALASSDFIPKQYKTSMLTPVVMCGPHGLRFKKHVLLILPHCLVVDDQSQREFKVLCSDTAPEDAPDWKEVFDASEEEQEDVFCNMGKQHFSLFVQHFSWYTIEGRGRAKNFKLAAYHTSFHQPNEDFKVRVYFIPIIKNSTVREEEVEKDEKKLKGTLCDSAKTKIFYENSGDIKVKAFEISEGWKIRGENTQIGGYEELCHCHDVASPNLTFVFEHLDTRPKKIFCKFRASQDACKFDKPVDLTLSVHFEAEINRAKMNAHAEAGFSTLSSSGYAGSGENATVAFIPTRLYKDLRELLDVEIVGTENYKLLADRLGYRTPFIRWLGSPNVHSPTDMLLRQWESDQGSRSPRDALRHLQEVLSEMKRVDAVEKIQEYFDELLIGKETTV